MMRRCFNFWSLGARNVFVGALGMLCACAHSTASPISRVHTSGVGTTAQSAPNPQQAAFVRGAIVALLLVYDDDADDPSLLLASLHQLHDDEALAPLRAEWQEPLSLGLARAHELQRLAPQLRAMRRAFGESFVDELTGNLLGVDGAQCKKGLLPPSDGGDTDDNLVVTIEPLGPSKLATLRRLCRSRTRPPAAELAPSQILRWPRSATGVPSADETELKQGGQDAAQPLFTPQKGLT